MATTRAVLFDYDEKTAIVEVSPMSCNIKWGISISTQWSFSLPLKEKLSKEFVPGRFVGIYNEDKLLVKGLIQETEFDYTNSFEVNISGRDYLDLLYQIPPYPLAVFKNVSYLQILYTLLNFYGWKINDFTNVYKILEERVTIDLRQKKTLAEQISDLMENAGGIQYRLSEQGEKSLDFGEFEGSIKIFGTQVTEKKSIFETAQITNLKAKTESDFAIGAISANGANVKITTEPTPRPITIGDGLTAQSALTKDVAVVENFMATNYTMYNKNAKGLGGIISRFYQYNTANVVYFGNSSSLASADTAGFIEILPSGLLSDIYIDVYSIGSADTNALVNGTGQISIELYGPVVWPFTTFSTNNLNKRLARRTFRNFTPPINRFHFNFDNDPIVIEETDAYFIAVKFENSISAIAFLYNTDRPTVPNRSCWYSNRKTGETSFPSNFFFFNAYGMIPFKIIIQPYKKTTNFVALNETYEDYKPANNDNVNPTEANNIGKALYKRLEQMILAKNKPRLLYNLTTTGLNNVLIPGNYIEIIFNQDVGDLNVDLDGKVLKVESLEFKFDNGFGEFSVSLTDLPLTDYTDNFVQTKKSTNKRETPTPIPTVINQTTINSYINVIKTITLVNNQASNAFVRNGLYGYEIDLFLTARHSIIGKPIIENASEKVYIESTDSPTKWILYGEDGWNNTITCTLITYWNLSSAEKKGVNI